MTFLPARYHNSVKVRISRFKINFRLLILDETYSFSYFKAHPSELLRISTALKRGRRSRSIPSVLRDMNILTTYNLKTTLTQKVIYFEQWREHNSINNSQFAESEIDYVFYYIVAVRFLRWLSSINPLFAFTFYFIFFVPVIFKNKCFELSTDVCGARSLPFASKIFRLFIQKCRTRIQAALWKFQNVISSF